MWTSAKLSVIVGKVCISSFLTWQCMNGLNEISRHVEQNAEDEDDSNVNPVSSSYLNADVLAWDT